MRLYVTGETVGGGIGAPVRGTGSPLMRRWVVRVWRGREVCGSSGMTVGEDVVFEDICPQNERTGWLNLDLFWDINLDMLI